MHCLLDMGGDDVERVAEDKGCVGLVMVKCSGGGGGEDDIVARWLRVQPETLGRRSMQFGELKKGIFG